MLLALILVAGLWAGLQNALAAGGSFVTLPALMLTGLTPLAANLTSTVALFPGQLAAGYSGRQLVSGAGRLSFRTLFGVSLLGGAVGGLLLLNTSSTLFGHLVPWLVLFATAVFAWGSFFRKAADAAAAAPQHPMGPAAAVLTQFLIAVYGGYFGGGIGFLMMASLAVAGVPARNATATKNVLAAVMNASAVALFIISPQVHWLSAAVLGTGAIGGGLAGAWALQRISERVLRLGVVGLGLALTVGLFLKPI